MFACFADMYVCVPCVCSARRGRKRVLDPLKLEVVSHRVGAGKEPMASARAANALNP